MSWPPKRLLMGLKESLPLLPSSTPSHDLPPWVVREYADAEDSITVELPAPVDLELTLNPVRAKASDIGKLQAQKFGDLLKLGYKPGEAAHRLKTSLNRLMEQPQTQEVVRKIVEGYTLEAAVRRLTQRALVNKGALENAADGGDPKLLLEYLKLMAADSEVGITNGPQVNLNVGIDPALKELLDRTVPLAELLAAPVIVEGETE